MVRQILLMELLDFSFSSFVLSAPRQTVPMPTHSNATANRFCMEHPNRLQPKQCLVTSTRDWGCTVRPAFFSTLRSDQPHTGSGRVREVADAPGSAHRRR